MTRAPMGSKLLQNTQARNTIEKLVRSDAISGDKAETWLQRLKDEDLVKATMRSAEDGDADASYLLWQWHTHGLHGLDKDDSAAFRWVKKGADMRDPTCMYQAGRQLMCGIGTEKQVVRGTAMLVEVAMQGSRKAAAFLGDCYSARDSGFPRCKEEANVWYKRALTGTIHDIDLFKEAVISITTPGNDAEQSAALSRLAHLIDVATEDEAFRLSSCVRNHSGAEEALVQLMLSPNTKFRQIDYALRILGHPIPDVE